MYNIDIDTGGTMTDGLVSGNGTVLPLKVETTPHDLAISFMNILEAAREALDFADLTSLLTEVEIIRWSSTITSNVLAQRVGPKLGLLVSVGHEDDLYSPEAAEAVVGTIIDRADISGIDPKADETVVRQAVKSLLDKGIRRINVSLAGAFPDPGDELRIVELITNDYPDHFLGSIPALAASEVVLRSDDSTRTVASLINAYVHPALATTLYRAEETARNEHGWHGNVLIGHINGGVARIGKTKAFDTIESGPLFGTHACAAAAATDGDHRVIAIDVGGTTAKASAVEDGRAVLMEEGDLFDIPVKLPLALLRSIALGGGSVARVKDGEITLGPDSMGAAPGPACYGLGGRNATITDAFVVCGFISPVSFLEGRRTLDVERARAALEKHIGQPLGLDAESAARAVVERAWDEVATLARETAEEAGWDPAECTIYAYGGNGPLFVTAVAERLGTAKARFFRYGSVYSAYGSAISDVVHVYDSALPQGTSTDAVAERLMTEARRDLRGEGFDPDAADYTWELRNPTERADGPTPSAAMDALQERPTLIKLTARFPLPRLEQPELSNGQAVSPLDTRPSAYGDGDQLPAYDADQLVDTELIGPFVADGASYTWLVTDGWILTSNSRGDAALHRKEL